MAIIHYNLRTHFKNKLTPKGYNDATKVNPSLNYTVSSNETWTSDRYFKGHITVKTNKTLTIKCLVAMTQSAELVIEPGAQLVLDGGHITNISGRLWDGIHMEGNEGLPQLTPNPANPGSVLHQGMLRIKNGGTISQAYAAVRSFHSAFGSGTGVILAQNAHFLNNFTDVQMANGGISYPAIASASWFYNCTFATTDTIHVAGGTSSVPPDRHVMLINITGVKFRGCDFKYSSPINSNHGTGIYSWNASYSVDKDLSDSCVFENLDYAIDAKHTNPLRVPAINNTVFKDNRLYAAYFKNINYLSFTNNRITAGPYSGTEGVYLNQCKYYTLKSNTFNSPYKNAPGISVFRSTTGVHQVYRNTFSNLLMGINCMDDNGNGTNPQDGLKLNCNRFHLGSSNYYDVVLSYTSGLALPRVNKTQGEIGASATASNVVRNIYGATCSNNQNKWQIYSGATYTINHGSNTNSLTAVTQPTASGCKSAYLNVVNKNIGLDFPNHCPENPLSSGGTSTISSNRLSVMNTYITDLKTDEINSSVSHHFEIQATVASKLNLFLTDSLNDWTDSIVPVLEGNQGYMEDAELQTVFAYALLGNYAIARDRTEELGNTRPELATALSRIMDVDEDVNQTVNTVENYGNYFADLADDPDAEGNLLAQTLLETCYSTHYPEPHALPEGEEDARSFALQNPNPTVNYGNERLLIYPNPTASGITLSYYSGNPARTRIEIRDLPGKLIYCNFISKGEASLYIPLEHLEKGLYLLTLSRNGKIIKAEKLIKE